MGKRPFLQVLPLPLPPGFLCGFVWGVGSKPEAPGAEEVEGELDRPDVEGSANNLGIFGSRCEDTVVVALLFLCGGDTALAHAT